MSKAAEALEEKLKYIIGAMEALLAPSESRRGTTVMADLLIRARMSSEIDGYPAGSGGERTSGGDVGDPVHGTVVARDADKCGTCAGTGTVFKTSMGKTATCRRCNGSGRRWADPVADAVESIGVLVRAIHVESKDVEKHRTRIMGDAPPKERVSSLQGNCLICGDLVTGVKDDRLKRGLDPKCYFAWGTWSLKNSTDDPGADFQRFTRHRREFIEKKKRQEEEAEAAMRRRK